MSSLVLKFEDSSPKKNEKIKVSIGPDGFIHLKPNIAKDFGFTKGAAFLLATEENRLHFINNTSREKIVLVIKHTNKIKLNHVFDLGRIKLDYKNINHQYEMFKETYVGDEFPNRVKPGDEIITLKPIKSSPRKKYIKRIKRKFTWQENLGIKIVQDHRTESKWYKVYKHIMKCCYASNGEYFKKHTVFEEWKWDFWKFADFIDSLYSKKASDNKTTLTRKDWNKNFIPENLEFCTFQEMTWRRRNSHKIEIDGIIKSTFEVHQILKTQGVKMSRQTVINRVGAKQDVGRVNMNFGRNLWKGEYKSLKDICKEEGGNYKRAKRWVQKGETIKNAIELSKTKHFPLETIYEYNGLKYNQKQLSKVLANELGTTEIAVLQRIHKGLSIEEIKKFPFKKRSI